MVDEDAQATDAPPGNPSDDGDGKLRTSVRIGAAIVFLIGLLYACNAVVDDDDASESDEEADIESEFSDSGGETVTDDDATPGTVVADHLKAATPVGQAVTDASTMMIDFEGDARMLAESTDVATFQVAATAGAGPIHVTLYCSTEAGVPSNTAVRNDAADAEETEDGGTVTRGTSGVLECTWTAPDSLTMSVSGFELPQDASTDVQVSIQESSSGEWVTLVLT